MGQSLPNELRVGLVEPQDAVAAFRQRKLLSPTFNWSDLWLDEHAAAFTVSRLLDLELLGFVRDELDKAIATGTSLKDWSATVRTRLQEAGWWGVREVLDETTGQIARTTFDPTRLQLIYDVNLRQSYAAGRWSRIERTASRNPYVRYRTMRDGRVRLSHQPWDGVTLPVNDPWWDTHYPPNGYRCRCEAYAVDQAAIDKLRASGQPVKMDAPPVVYMPYVNRATGETLFTPAGIDPGFGYNPGKARALSQAQILDRKARATLQPADVTRLEREWIMSEPQRRAYAAWVDAVLASAAQGSRGRIAPVGFVSDAESTYMAARGKTPAPGPIELSDRLMVGPKAERHEAIGNELTADEWKDVPAAIAQPRATLYDTETGNLVYVAESRDGRAVKLVVAVGYSRGRAGLRNDMRSAHKAVASDLANDIRRGKFTVIEGSVE